MKVPPPPKVGDGFYGPSRTERARLIGPFATRHQVRAVVDAEASQEFDHLYMVVLRWWSPRKGWRYVIEDQFAFTPMAGSRGLYAMEMGRR